MQKPNGLTVLTGNDIESRLWPLPIRKLYGIGPKTEEHLRAMNIATIGQLAAMPLKSLIQRFGHAYGRYLFEAARGIDESPLITHWEPKSFSRETTFQEDVKSWQTIAKIIAGLSKEILDDLIRKDCSARTVTLKIRFSDFHTITRACSAREAVRSEYAIRRLALSSLKRVDLEGKRVRLVGVRVGNLEKNTRQSQSLDILVLTMIEARTGNDLPLRILNYFFLIRES